MQNRTVEKRGWRGGESTRLETLTDTVFGFSITLLVVSLEVPEDFDALLEAMTGFIAFAFSFAILILVWYYHYHLFTRFRLDDTYTIFLNSVLLFVVLFYVYPLKFLFRFLAGALGGEFAVGFDDIPLLMTIYATGFIAVFTVFALLYLHAWRIRDKLSLDARESLTALEHVYNCLIMAGIGVLSVLLAQTLPAGLAGAASGFVYFLIGPVQYLNGRYFGKRKDALP